jgi:hypothetical protein
MVSPTRTRPRPTPPSAGPTRAARVPRTVPPDPPATSAPRVTGRYRLDPRSTAWWWSPEMFDVLGIPAEGTRPSTELLLQSQHRADRARTLEAITESCATGRPFALETRVLRPDGATRVVVLVGEPQTAEDDGVTALEGMCVDVTGGRLADDDDVVVALEAEVTQLRTAMASRACIEQAKGILMLLTSCTEQVAFELLAHMSSHTHRKVREVAESITESATGRTQLPEDLRAILRDACPPAPRSG